MKPANIATASYLDIIFDGRNKEYGAYQLRNRYGNRMWWALGLTFAICAALVALSYVSPASANESGADKLVMEEHVIHTVKEEPNKPPPPPVPPRRIEIPQIKTVKLTTAVIVDNDKVIEPPPTQTDLQESRIGSITANGVKDNGIVAPPQVLDDNKGIVQLKKEVAEDDTPFLKVEIDAEYPGGAGAWRNFLERNLRSDTPAENGAAPGHYTVIVQFIVDKNGGLSDLKPLTSIGWGMEQEALRVIKKSGKWKPAIQNGRAVTAYRKQPVTFIVLEP